jgi:hypothetical protein
MAKWILPVNNKFFYENKHLVTSEALKNGANSSLRYEHEKGNTEGSRYPH